MSGEAKLCQDCVHLIWSVKQCARSRMAPDYVFGKPAKTRDAQIERENTTADGCGPKAIHFVAYQVAADATNAYTEAMIRQDLRERYEGRPDHDTDIVGRAMKAGM